MTTPRDFSGFHFDAGQQKPRGLTPDLLGQLWYICSIKGDLIEAGLHFLFRDVHLFIFSARLTTQAFAPHLLIHRGKKQLLTPADVFELRVRDGKKIWWDKSLSVRQVKEMVEDVLETKRTPKKHAVAEVFREPFSIMKVGKTTHPSILLETFDHPEQLTIAMINGHRIICRKSEEQQIREMLEERPFLRMISPEEACRRFNPMLPARPR
ncbi:MAG: hypothetical protein Q8Q20_03745 [bacterium]|nr:hypothetical protein [bacterium]